MIQASRWSMVSREERFFTSILFSDINSNHKPFLNMLLKKLDINTNNISMIDIGYEVCFFRDTYRAKLITKRMPEREKETFDLVVWLSDQSIVIIEAKAQQGFHAKQLRALKESQDIIPKISSPNFPIRRVYLVGICSSIYTPKNTTISQFNAMIRWNEIASKYPSNGKLYNRADDIYRQ